MDEQGELDDTEPKQVESTEANDSSDRVTTIAIRRWRSTFFFAVISAYVGEPLWARESGARTQRRHIEFAARWLGLLADRQEVELIAELVGVGLMVHAQARQSYTAAATTRKRSAAIVKVLRDIPYDRNLLARMLRAGQVAGIIGRAFVFDEARCWTTFHQQEFDGMKTNENRR